GDRDALPPLYIRINDLTSGFAEADLDAVVALGPDGLMLPKVRGGEDVRAVSGFIDGRERAAGPAAILATSPLSVALDLCGLEAVSDAYVRRAVDK
ncbi:MAG: aldolase/citrate lyase family protein, partial [Methyloligellaceae bacterium]